jgi:hypothetical protein
MSKKAVHTMGLPTPINNWARSRSRLIMSFPTYQMGTTLARKSARRKNNGRQHHKFQLKQGKG